MFSDIQILNFRQQNNNNLDNMFLFIFKRNKKKL